MGRLARGRGETIFDAALVVFFVGLSFIMIFPFWTVLMTSLVNIGEFTRRPVIWWPRDLTPLSYQYLFSTPRFVRSIGISVYITALGTLWGLFLTSQVAYALSKKTLPGRNFLLIVLTFTMFFSGGLIPVYLWIRTLGLMNTYWALILPIGVNVWNFIVMKAFFNQLPQSLEESAKMDGANDIVVFWRIVVPLSKPLFATFGLFYSVALWNSWFPPLLYITDRDRQPLALVLRQMVVSQIGPPGEIDQARRAARFGTMDMFLEGLNAAAVIVATIPILCIYPWLQKYFAKGVMLGSVKG